MNLVRWGKKPGKWHADNGRYTQCGRVIPAVNERKIIPNRNPDRELPDHRESVCWTCFQ